MPGWTNRGKFMALKRLHDGTALPTNYYIALVTSATAPTADTNVMSDLTEIAAGNGYTAGGFSLSLNGTDFDTAAEDDGSDFGSMKIKDVVWTASGGSIPASGNGARYAVLTDDNGTVSLREVYYYWDLSSDRSISDTQTLTLQDLEIQITET
jgi:hypothetical protein